MHHRLRKVAQIGPHALAQPETVDLARVGTKRRARQAGDDEPGRRQVTEGGGEGLQQEVDPLVGPDEAEEERQG